MTYSDAIQFLYSLRLFGAKLGLENTSRLAELCGNPQERLRFIHVAGTNGKGSTCAMLESVYRAAGYRAGLFTSPHLVSFTERLQVDRRPIVQSQVVQYVQEMVDLLAAENGTPNPEEWTLHPTFFEFVTVMALRHFADQRCELVIWETGMGGRLDATNIVTPLASVITNIQFDHQNWLGETAAQIALEKAGIIKPGLPVITGATAPEAIEIIRKVAREKHAPLAEVSQASLDDPFIAKINLPLTGLHQLWNAAVALATIRALQHLLPVSHQHVIDGFEKVDWPGRQQVVTKGATRFLLDGAHNPDGIATLRDSLLRSFPGQPFTLILGLFQDKDWRTMCRLILPLASRVLLVPVQSERSADPAIVREFCENLHPPVHITPMPSLGSALEEAANDSFVVIAGSLHLVGEALERLGLAGDHPSERELNEWDAARVKSP